MRFSIELAARAGTVAHEGMAGVSNSSIKFDLEFKARGAKPFDFIGLTRRFTIFKYDLKDGFSLSGLIDSISSGN